MRRLWIVAAAAVVLAAGSCGGGGAETRTDTAAEVDGVAADTGSDSAVLPDVKELPPDLPPDLGPELPEHPELPDQDAGPPPGEAGWPCEKGTDCGSGICIQTADGGRCTVECAEECPFSWECVPYPPSLPDQVSVCTPFFLTLCRPCLADADCLTNEAETGEACVSYGGSGSFCGGPCEDSADCPDGYGCKESTDAAGMVVKQCVLLEGECECAEAFAKEGATTTCYTENPAGKCTGERMCKGWGLTDCSADVPAAEECDGLDNDCDGTVDEETAGGECPVTNSFGTCPGTWECTSGKPICVGEAALKEQCNGKDDDCDGSVDEGFDDTDEDGVADCLENDKDGDGIPDGLDDCPSNFNPDQKDFDLDTVGDVCDPDDDNDLAPDASDCGPFDQEVHPGKTEVCDGKDNDCNGIVDEGFPDTDLDGWKDCMDEDDDNDGVDDPLDCAAADPDAHPGAAEECDGKDNDCDQQVDEGFPDADLDGIPDCMDEDGDGDGVANKGDNCPLAKNPDQEDLDGDGVGDACDSDGDGDSIPDKGDNCPGLKNTQQTDTDGDGLGDACDDDLDGDGVGNAADNCPLVKNPDQADADGDGTGDACETDKDGDGTPDLQDCKPDDPAVHPGATEVCDGTDNDCDLQEDEGFPDADLDGLKNCVDPDDDNDGDPDETDCAPLDPKVHHQAAEACDGVDNNCAAGIDEGIPKLTCGKGMCAHTVSGCVNGKVQTCDPFAGASQEVCDGKDNDCNGLTDEGLGTVTCGKGECLHTQPACADGEVQACDPMQGAAIEECDGLDNDCDGLVDEKLGTLSCGLGVCKHTVPACLDGEPQECDPTQGAGMEVCDGLDNDCNGLVDEGIGNVACGKGECLHEQPYCKDGKVTVCDPFKGASQEVCDGLDNDCNGLVDENQWPLTCGQGICLHTVPGCVAGEVPVCDPLDGAAAEECDAKDNDCDGLVDEGLGFTTCGVGVCLHTVANCSEGEPQECDPMQGAGTELCDGKDNDCNGTSDPENAIGCTPYYLDSDADGYGVTGKSKCLCAPLAPYSTPTAEDCNDANPAVSPAAAESCTNLIDDDCDGKVNDGCAYTSCKAALQEVPASPSGLYSLDPDGAGGNEPFLAWCDMTTSGGGWTLVMTAGTTSAYLYGHNVWTDASGGTAAGCDPGLDQDCVSRAFYTLSGTESMLALGSTANWNSWYHKKETPRNLANQPRMAGGYGAAGDCTAQTNCGTEPVNLKPLGIQAACSMSYSTKWHRFGYVNDVNSWGTNTRVGFTGDNDGSDSSDSVMGIGLQCYNACVPNSCTGSPHNSGAGWYLYTSWAAQPLDGAARGWLWIR